MPKSTLLVFTKTPLPGRVKTRLAASVGEEIACDLYVWMGKEIFDAITQVPGLSTKVVMAPEDSSDERVRAWLGKDIEIWVQHGDDLGERLANATQDAFDEGAEKVLIVGLDAPDMAARHIEQALAALDEKDACLIPTSDGGYILIGLTRPEAAIFEGIEYGTETVFYETRNRIRAHAMTWAELPEMHDLDTADDIRHFPTIEDWLVSKNWCR
ncbi:MAG: TIGR04282 family arsenosugar biosynthesis glycosyltransferase [Deltaproteobacteria bacterium]|nr:TIGR04282 family arsenosugar biosynthesis glycosyltransferase [Deltaproteobacteria bacterium]